MKREDMDNGAIDQEAVENHLRRQEILSYIENDLIWINNMITKVGFSEEMAGIRAHLRRLGYHLTSIQCTIQTAEEIKKIER